MQASFKFIIVFISLTVVLISCAPASTPVPTLTAVPPTASPTQTATATPLPTLTPTATPVPIIEPGSREWWDKTLAENYQYVPGGIGLGEKTARDLKFNPKADQVAIHDQILASNIRQLMIPENKPILDKLLQQHPEWAGTAWNSIANPFELRLQIMNAVMEITGGRLFTKLWPSNQVALWDANQPVQFECDEVAKLPSVDGVRINTNSKSPIDGSYLLAYGTIISDGKLTYRIERTSSGWQLLRWPRDFYCTHMSLYMIEWQARNMESWSNFTDRQPTFVDFHKFALDLRDPFALINPDVWGEGFLKLK